MEEILSFQIPFALNIPPGSSQLESTLHLDRSPILEKIQFWTVKIDIPKDSALPVLKKWFWFESTTLVRIIPGFSSWNYLFISLLELSGSSVFIFH